MTAPPHNDVAPGPAQALLTLLRQRRSRRFGRGMTMPGGPLAHTSRHPGAPLSEEEEAVLAFAGAGVTGPALCDLNYDRGQGGTMMVGFLGRTVPSGDAIHGAFLMVLSPNATYYMKRPQDFAPGEAAEAARLAERGEFVELYTRSRVKVRDGRAFPPTDAPFNLNINRWSLYDPAGTYFLPVNELTLMYVNGLLEAFNETTGYFILDERAGFRPAGLARFARSRGGHLCDDPGDGRVVTVQQFESIISHMVMVEHGAMIQNLSLMATAVGLGGFPHWAAHPFAWFQALGFRMAEMGATRFAGMGAVRGWVARRLGLDHPVPYPVGLEVDGRPVVRPYCPPYYPSMADAVRAVVDLKFGPRGAFRGGAGQGGWVDPAGVAAAPAPSEATVAAVIAYCEYVYGRYGRFPAYYAPFNTGLGFQANHLDLEFYDRFYRPEAVTDQHRNHFHAWHGSAPADTTGEQP